MRTLENITIHLKYWILILIGLLILVACDRWTGQQNFTEYLTNVATFVSLVLGLVAIIYSFYSNSTLSMSLGNITKVSEDVSLTKNEIGKFLDESKVLTDSSKHTANLMSELSTHIQLNIDTLKDTIKSIDVNATILQAGVDNIKSIKDSWDSFSAKTPNPNETGITDSLNPAVEKQLFDRFLSRLSILGVIFFVCS